MTFEQSVSTKMADIGVEPHIIEVCLNHYSGHRSGPAGITIKSGYAGQMRVALGLWQDRLRSLLDGAARKVIVLPTK